MKKNLLVKGSRKPIFAPRFREKIVTVAQLDRASHYGCEGLGFDSLRYHRKGTNNESESKTSLFFFLSFNIEMEPNREQKSSKILTELAKRIAQIENGADADQTFAILKQLQALFESNSSTHSQELDIINSIMKKEMRIYWRTKFAKDKKNIVARLNQLL